MASLFLESSTLSFFYNFAYIKSSGIITMLRSHTTRKLVASNRYENRGPMKMPLDLVPRHFLIFNKQKRKCPININQLKCPQDLPMMLPNQQ